MQKRERILLINRVCEQFESKLKSGSPDDLEQVLEATAKDHPDPDLRDALLAELIALEIFYSDDRDALAASLAARFPDQSANIQNALNQPSVHATLAAGGDQTNAVASAVQTPLPTVRVGERFADLKHHASGGLGDVYIGYDKSVRRQVAVKLLKPEFVADAEAKSRFHNEAAITGALEHPGIVPIYDSGISEEGQPFYAMRLLDGETLKDAVLSLHKNRGATDFEERQRQLIRRLIDVCDAISYAHDNGVIHRDLKPANVVLGSYGDSVVIDWGLARSNSNPIEEPKASEPVTDSSGQQFQTRLGSVLGTPEYMSPEQASGNPETVGTASDIYSLGTVLYSILTGVAPIGNQTGTIQDRIELAKRADFPSAKQRVSSIPVALNEICSRAMRVSPSERYATPRELARDLDNWLSDQPIVAKPDTMLERGFRFLRKHRRWAAAAAATLVAITVGSTVAATVINKQSGELETRRSEAERQAKENAALADAEAENARLYLQAGEDNQAYVDFVTGVFKKLDPDAFGKDARLADVLTEIAKQLDARDDLSGEATLDILATLGSAYLLTRQDVEALEVTRKYVDLAIELDSASSLTALDGRAALARALVNVEEPKEALEVTEAAIKDLDKVLPDLAAEDSLVSEARETRGHLIRGKITALRLLGRGKEERAAWEELYPWLQDLDLENLPTTRDELHYAGQYVEMLRRTGVTDQALEWQKKIYEANKRLSDGSDSSKLLGNLFRLSQAIAAQQGQAAALPYRKELVERASKFLGPTHTNTLIAKSNLADTLFKVGEHEESRDRLLPLQSTFAKLGTNLGSLSQVETKLARVQLVLGNEKDALELMQAVQDRISNSEEIDQLSNTGIIAMYFLSLAQMENGLIDEALKSLTHEAELFKAAGKSEDPDLRPRLQLAYMLKGDFDSALKQREHLSSDVSHKTILESAITAECLFEKGKHEEATELAKQILALPPAVGLPGYVARSKCLQSHMRGLLARMIAGDDPAKSEELLIQAVTELEQKHTVLLPKSLLARVLRQHGQSLIDWYSSKGNKTQASHWRERLSEVLTD